jgi:hypothetical protein
MAQAVTILIYFREVIGSNVRRHTWLPDWVFSLFLSTPKRIAEQYLETGYDCFLPHLSQFIIHFPSYY